MGGKQKTELSEKHWQALRMIEEGVARKDVAAKMGWGVDYFKKLCCGDVSTVGYTADIFKKQLQQIESKIEEETKALVKENTCLAQEQVKRVLKEFKSKKRLNYDDKKLLSTLTNVLNNSTPAVSIKNLSYSYVSGLTAEDLLHEFTKLKSIAEASFNRGRVQESGSGEPGILPAADESGSGMAEGA